MKALIAEDEARLANNIRKYLSREEFDGKRFEVIKIAENGAIALELIEDDYDMVILDLKMPKKDGTQVIRAINRIEPPQKRPWVVLITAYPGAYETARLAVKMGARALLEKPFELSELMEVIRELLKVRHQLLDAEKRGIRPGCQWTLALSDTGPAFIQAKGLLNFADSCSLSWTRWDSMIAKRGTELVGLLAGVPGDLHGQWRFQAKMVGMNLFERLFQESVRESFVAAGACVLHSHDLKMRFVGPRHYLELPLEFLNDGAEYLALRHPMKRFVSGVKSKGETNFSELLNNLQNRREKLRILLIASNTPPEIEGVEQEVAALYDQLNQVLPAKHFTIDYLPTEKATCAEVMARLTGCRYHVLHYAGHGCHDRDSPRRSRLFFWEKENRQGKVKSQTVDELKNTLRRKGHDLRFVYLSCCASATISDESALLDDDFLGIADGLVLAGVPSVLGFRWPVNDQGAKKLALAFYESLFVDQDDLDTALFNARCKVAGTKVGQKSGDWLSPILIVQG